MKWCLYFLVYEFFLSSKDIVGILGWTKQLFQSGYSHVVVSLENYLILYLSFIILKFVQYDYDLRIFVQYEYQLRIISNFYVYDIRGRFQNSLQSQSHTFSAIFDYYSVMRVRLNSISATLTKIVSKWFHNFLGSL